MKKILIMLVLNLIVCGCNSKEKTDLTYTKNELIEQVLSQNDYIIVDVRTKEEYDESHIIGAINIPYDEIDENSNLDKNKTILVYCKSGNRSKVAFNTLTSLGYTTYDLGAFSEINLPKE